MICSDGIVTEFIRTTHEITQLHAQLSRVATPTVIFLKRNGQKQFEAAGRAQT